MGSEVTPSKGGMVTPSKGGQVNYEVTMGTREDR